MSHETTDNPSLKVLELELTQTQVKELQRLLPKGYKLEIITHKRDTTPKPTKKVITEGQVPKRSLNSDVESISSNQRGANGREPRRKKPVHFDDRYADYEHVPTTSSKNYRSNDDGVRKCFQLLTKLKKHNCSGPFLRPVDVDGLGLMDYYDIVTEPMDLSTVETKLQNGEYTSVNQFAEDIRKIWNNAFRYNAKGTAIYQMTSEMASLFEKLFKEIEHLSFNDTIRDLEKKVERLSKQISEYGYKGGARPGSLPPLNRGKSTALDKEMSMQEKKILGQNIRSLPAEYLRGVWEIVCDMMPHQQDKEEIEFDLDKLPTRVLRELEKYVNAKVAILEKKKPKQPVKPVMKIDPTKRLTDYPLVEQPVSINSGGAYGFETTYMGGNGYGAVREDDNESKSSESSFISE
jgi:hypothetical protein